MLDLALHHGESPIPLKDVAERHQISEKYLWNLIGPLKTAGLINAVRGSYGGYSIARPPAEVNLKDIICAVEGPLCLVECVRDPSICERAQTCVTRDIWCEVSGKILQVLEAITLQDMIDKQKSKKVGLSYAI